VLLAMRAVKALDAGTLFFGFVLEDVRNLVETATLAGAV
jgi:hypothetical protein